MQPSRQLTVCLAVVLLLAGTAVWAQQPQHVSYQGQLEKNGVLFDGNADFKFAMVANSTTLWSHDGSSSGGSEPTTALALTVTAGLFSVLLGDATSGQQPLLPSPAWNTSDGVLRVWVDTGSGFEQLSDQPLSSALYARMAETANAANLNFTVPGNLGVGLATPLHRVHVDGGDVLIEGPGSFDAASESATLFLGSTDHYVRATWGSGLSFGSLLAADGLFMDQWTGNVGIGTTTPAAKLDVQGDIEVDGFKLNYAPVAGYVLTADATGVGTWQPSGGTGGPDADWLISGSDLIAIPGGNVGIGTGAPLHKLHVAGTSRFDLGSGRIEINTPGGWPGLIGYSSNGHRRDFIVDDVGLRLLVAGDGNAPGSLQGIVINEQGWLGVDKVPSSNLDVLGKIRGDELAVDGPNFDVFHVSGDAIEGAVASFRGGGGLNDLGVRIQGAGTAGGGILDLYNNAGDATIDLQGDISGSGVIYVGNSSGLSAAINGSGGKFQAYNSFGTLTFEAAGQAFGSGSQTRTYDANALLCDEWTATAREWKVWDDSGVLQMHSRGNTSGGEMSLYQTDGQNGVLLDGDSSGSGHVNVYDTAGVVSVQIIGEDSGGDGRVITDVVEITGGSDLSENFDINTASVAPGMVVCIDAEEPGRLVVSERAYARTVAGVVSGAGGVKPGLLMGQRGSIADGAYPVALTGRVWTWCDASSEPIQPGDLLTSSDVAGHAMRVSDHPRSQGAVIGKAMSTLSSGRGLVLVLVSLQ